MTNAPSPNDRSDVVAEPSVDGARTPAHRARKIAAAVSAGAFAGIAVGLVATHAGADDSPDTSPISADGGVQQQSPFGQSGTQDLDGDGRTGDPGDYFGQGGSSGQFGPPQFGGSTDGGSGDGATEQFAPPSSGSATPAPFGGQTAPDTNSGGS